MSVALQHRLAASLEGVDRLCAELRDGVLSGIPKSERFVVELLLREALNNAILHGNVDCGGTVWCELEPLQDGIAIRVWDAGDGFNWRDHLGTDYAPRAESGRGIQILSHYASALRFNEKGNWVEMIRTFSQGEHDGKF